MDTDDAEIDFDFDDFNLADEPPREARPLLPTDKEVAELSDRIYGPSETGSAYGLKHTRNAPIEGMTKTRRNEIIAKGKRSNADYVGDADYSTFNDAWRDAATVIQERKIQERKIQETKNKKTNKKRRKRPTGGAKITKSKKHRKNKSRKSRYDVSSRRIKNSK